MYTYLAEKIIFPLGDLFLHTSVIKYYHWLQQTQWWSPEQLRDLQSKKLKALIKHAYENVPYYRRIFDERGLTVKDIQTTDDLIKLPILTKNDIRQNYQDILAKNFKMLKPIASSTSGSSGEPLQYYITKDVASINWAGMFRGWGWSDYLPGDKRVNIGGSAMVPVKSLDFQKRIRLFLERTILVSTLDMNEQKMNDYVKKLLRYKPRYIYGYASSIYLLAEYLIKHNIDGIQPRCIFSTSELLLLHYRTTIQKAFHSQVIDCYGSYDGGSQAIECSSHDGYHITSEKTIIEFVDRIGKPVNIGQPGEIICTDLYNYAMPFIRYAVGDVGVLENKVCSCGRGLPLMKSIEGRSLDFIFLPNGKKIRGLDFVDVFYQYNIKDDPNELATIIRFQIVQNTLDELIIRIVQEASPTEDEIKYIKSKIGDILAYPLNIKVEFTNALEDSISGKRKFIISNIRI
jgi:phenylacetate-CoA ligase